jgi:hypothetical protein
MARAKRKNGRLQREGVGSQFFELQKKARNSADASQLGTGTDLQYRKE